MKKQSKILIISHQYLPHVSPRTTRWKLIIEELTNRGHEVTLLTGTYPDFENKNINVLYFGNKNNLNIVSNLREKSKRAESKKLRTKFFYSLLKKIYRSFIKFVAWPDYSMVLDLSDI